MCGTIISKVDDADWYSHMSIKYCSTCRKQSDRKKTAERMKELRKRQKEKNKIRDEQIKLLDEQLKLIKEENEMIRRRIIRLREEKVKYY